MFFFCFRTALETDLRIEREWRGGLQKQIEQEKLKNSELQTEIHQLRQLQSEHEELQKRFMVTQTQCEEHEKTLAELGSHLSE